MQERTRWLVLAGVLLVAGVIGWRLSAGSYKSDIQKICMAEKSSGADAKQDVKKVEAYAKDHLETPEASAWLSELVKKGVGDRAKGLRDESARVGVGACPLVATYEAIFAEGEYRQDLTALCSTSDLPAIEAADDEGRLKKILAWIDGHAKSPRTKALSDKLSKAEPKARADALREEVTAAAVYQCELVATLVKPQASAPKDEPVIELGSPQINGDLSIDKIVATFLAKKDAMRKCYDDGLAKKPDLAGKLLLKLAVAPGGKTIKATIEGPSGLPDVDVVRCVAKTAKELVFPPTASPLVTLLLPLQFVPKASLVPQPPPDPHGH